METLSRESQLAREQMAEIHKRPPVAVDDAESTEPPVPFHPQRQAIERAAATARKQIEELNPEVFTEEEIARRRTATLAKFDEVVSEQLPLVQEAAHQARDVLTLTEVDDPLDRLTPAQMANAETHRWVVQEDAALPYSELVPRLRAALAEGLPHFLALWNRYLTRRVATERAEGAHIDLDGSFRGGRVQNAPPLEFWDAYHQLQERVASPDRSERRKQAESTLGDASGFEYIYVNQIRRELTGEEAKDRQAWSDQIRRAF